MPESRRPWFRAAAADASRSGAVAPAVRAGNGLVRWPRGTNRQSGSTMPATTLGGVATKVDDRLEVRLGGLAQKRGLIPRMPAGDRLLADTTVWLNGEYAEMVRSTRTRTLAGGETELAIDLHPATTAVVLTADDAARSASVRTRRSQDPDTTASSAASWNDSVRKSASSGTPATAP